MMWRSVDLDDSVHRMCVCVCFVAQIGTWDSQQGLEISRPVLQAETDATQAPNRTLIVTTIKAGAEISHDTMRYDTRCYFNVRSKADISQLNLPHGNDN